MENEDFYGQHEEYEADMKDQSEINYSSKTQNYNPFANIDPVLFSIAQGVENANSSVAMTLLIDGTIVSGNLISIDRYFSDIHSALSSGVSFNPNEDEVAESINSMTSFFHETKELMDEYPNDDFRLYLHLKNAVIHQATKERDMEIPLFRVALRSVSGFNLSRPHPDLPIL